MNALDQWFKAHWFDWWLFETDEYWTIDIDTGETDE